MHYLNRKTKQMVSEDVEIYYYKTETKIFIRSFKLPKGIISQ